MNRKIDIDAISGVAMAVHHNMSFLHTVSVTDVMAECCFRNPAIEYLERKQLGSKHKIYLEYRHPVFKSKRIDLAWEMGKKAIGKPNIFLEMKYVKAETANESEFQRYFNDLTRLAILCSNYDANSDSNYKCYFIASGNSFDWNNCFKSIAERNTGSQYITPIKNEKDHDNTLKDSLYSQWLSFDIDKNERTINTDDYKHFYDYFCNHYKKRSTDDNPRDGIIYKTKLLWLSDQQSPLMNTTCTGLWEVLVNVKK